MKSLKKIYVPGLNGISFYELGEDFFLEIFKESIITKSSALAFRFLLAIFPALLFVFTLIPFVPIANFQNSLLDTFEQILPQNVFDAAETTLTEIISKQNKELLSAGFFASIFLSTNGVSALIKSLNKKGLVLRKRTYIARRYTALILTFLLTILLLGSAVIGIAGEFSLGFLEKHHFIRGAFGHYFLILMQWLIVNFVFFFAIALLYYYGPALKYKRRFFSPGAAFAAFFCILATFGFAQYVQHFGNYNKVYGSLGTLMVIMILLYFNSIILLIGFDLDSSIETCISRKLNPTAHKQKPFSPAEIPNTSKLLEKNKDEPNAKLVEPRRPIKNTIRQN